MRQRGAAKRGLTEARSTDSTLEKFSSEDLFGQVLDRLDKKFLEGSLKTGQPMHGDPRFADHIVDVAKKGRPKFERVDHRAVTPFVSLGQSAASPTIDLERDYALVYRNDFDAVFPAATDTVAIQAVDDAGEAVGKQIEVSVTAMHKQSLEKEFQPIKIRKNGKRFLIFAERRSQRWPSKVLLLFDDERSVVVALSVKALTESGLVNKSNTRAGERSSRDPSAKLSSDYLRLVQYKKSPVSAACFFPGADKLALLLYKGKIAQTRQDEYLLFKRCFVEVFVKKNDADFSPRKIARIVIERGKAEQMSIPLDSEAETSPSISLGSTCSSMESSSSSDPFSALGVDEPNEARDDDM